MNGPSRRQANGACLPVMFDRWLSTLGVKLTGTLSSSNMLALIGMTVSGLGVTWLPLRCLTPMIDGGMLAVIKVTPSIPNTPYVALYRSDHCGTLIKSIAMLAQESCNFTRMFQTKE